MFIICPKCFTKFDVAPDTIQKSVQTFECCKCHHRFTETMEKLLPLVLDVQKPIVPESDNDVVNQSNTFSADEFDTSLREPAGLVPEEFQPVENAGMSGAKKVIFLLGVFAAIVGIFLFLVWRKTPVLMEDFPALQKGMAILTSEQQSDASEVAFDFLNAQEKTVVPEIVPMVNVGETEEKPAIVAVNQLGFEENTASESTENVVQGQVNSVTLENEMAQPDTQLNEMPTPIKNVPTDVMNVTEEVVLEDIPFEPDVKQVPATETVLVQPIRTVYVSDVVFDENMSDGQNHLIVSGMVQNPTDEMVEAPLLVAFVYDVDGRVIAVRELPAINGKLVPHSGMPFTTDLKDIALSVDKVEVKVKEN